MVVALILGSLLAYWWYFCDGSSFFFDAADPVSVRARPRREAKKMAPVPEVKRLYKPQLVGHSTGVRKVFQTNKGLRIFEVNEYGMPLPRANATQEEKVAG